MFKPIFTSSRSVTFELTNTSIYYAPAPFDVYMNGERVRSAVSTNVFSLFGLRPKTQYEVRINQDRIVIETANETASLNVRDFGAKGDGLSDDTEAIQTAIYACPDHGRVQIPAGTYLIHPLFLKSHLTIELEQKAVLFGNNDRSLYPVLPAKTQKADGSMMEVSTWEGESQPTFASLITGIEVHDVSIIGEGLIDENAQNGDWWAHPRDSFGGAYRPKGIFLAHCEHIVLQGITVKNTPSWNLHPYLCQDISILDVKLINPKDSPNTDGCNPESCSGVMIIGVDFSVGDDCIAIKSGKYERGSNPKKPCEKITIRNCHMAYGHGAIVLGSECSGGIRDLEISQCYFEKTDRGLRIKTRRGRGNTAVIDGVTFENIYMNEVLTPLVMNMFYYCDDDGKTEYVWSKNPLPLDDRTPYLGHFTFKNMTCENVHVAAGFFYGLPEQPIASITLENITFSYAKHALPGIPAMMSFLEPMEKAGLIFKNVRNVVLNHASVQGASGEAVTLENVSLFKNV